MCRNDITIYGNLQQLFLTYRITFRFRKLSGQRCIAFSQNHNGIAHNAHTAQLIAFFDCLRILQEIDSSNCLFNVLLVIQKSLCVDFLRTDRMTRTTLLHKFCKYSCFIAVLPFL